jgi:MFS transporter, PCFT/HCP family, solute carrier family 46, member 3
VTFEWPEQNTAMSADPKPVVVEEIPQESGIRKYLKLITVEPVVICWLLPFLLTYSATENILIEKGCRGFAENFDKDICKIFVRKDNFEIECDESNNVTSIGTINRDAISQQYPEVYKSIENNFDAAMNFLCQVEEQVQTKLSGINAIRNPIAAIGPLVIILFAGPWSDKKNLRVPCMIVPFLGEAIGYFSENF